MEKLAHYESAVQTSMPIISNNEIKCVKVQIGNVEVPHFLLNFSYTVPSPILYRLIDNEEFEIAYKRIAGPMLHVLLEVCTKVKESLDEEIRNQNSQ